MSEVISDGSVIPKYFSPHGPIVNSQNDMAMRMGRVTNVYYPTDQGNVSKSFVEYDVLVDYIDSSGIYSKVLYPRCLVVSKFGGAADFEFYTYRQTTITQDQLNVLDKGSVVLLLCINGDRRQGYIVGGIPTNFLAKNTNFQNLALAAGTNYVWEFNGAIINVNDNGELSLKYTGKTNNDGTPASSVDADNALSEILFDDQGQLTLSTNDSNFILISNEDDGFVNVNAGTAINLFATDGNIGLVSNNPLKGVQTGDATDFTMLGSTYRGDESTMDIQLIEQFNTLATQLTDIGTSLSTAATLIIIPMVGAILAAPEIANAGATLAAASASMEAISGAITSFESEADSHLSTRNRSD